MKAYKQLTIYGGIISFCSLIICLIFHYFINGDEAAFWINVCLAIFGSALLSTFTSLIMYQYEKVKTLENFVYHTKQLLHIINKYQDNMSLDKKILFYLEYNDFDKSAWDTDYGNIDFFFERMTGDRLYIYNKVYCPILVFNKEVSERVPNFRWHLDKSGKNDAVMQQFVGKLETYLIDKRECEVPGQYDDDGKVISTCKMSCIVPKLEIEISQELNGRYYEIMYGKRKAKSMSEEDING